MRPLLLVILLLAALLGSSQVANAEAMPADVKEARLVQARPRGEHYVKRLGHFLDQSAEWKPGGIVFVGDSITEHFPLAEAFPGQNVINQGIGGDKIGGVRERLDVVVKAKPATIYLMIGTNDVAWRETATSTTLAQDYALLLDEMKAAVPDATLIVQSVLPTGRAYAKGNARVRELNSLIQAMAKSRGLQYLDLYPHLQGPDGLLDSRYTTDGIHLTLAGYWRWLREIRTDAELLASARGLAQRWMKTFSAERTATKVNPPVGGPFGGGRGENELIVYTPEYGSPTTGTNAWGTEAIVRNGVVGEANPSNSAIPADGFVVSGHGVSAQWVSMNLRPGVQVNLDGSTLRISVPESIPVADKLNHMEGLIVSRMAAGDSSAEVDQLFLLLQQLRREELNAR